MRCEFCGTNHNEYNCPNCNAPAPEPPKKAAAPAPPPAAPARAATKAPKVLWALLAIVMLPGILFVGFSVLAAILSPNTSSAGGGQIISMETSMTQQEQQAALMEALLAGSEAYRTLPQQDYKAQALPLLADTRADMLRNPAQHQGVDYVFDIKIIEEAEYKEGDTGYLGVVRDEQGRWPWLYAEGADAAQYVYAFVDQRGDDAPKLFAGDIVTIYGDFRNAREFSDYTLGYPTVPFVQMRYSDFVQDAAAILPLGSEAYQTLPEQDYKAQAQQTTFTEIKRYPAKYIGTDVLLEVRIRSTTVVDGQAAYVADVRLAGGEWPTWESYDETVLVLLDARTGENAAQIYAKDVIYVYADYAGILHTGDSIYNTRQRHVFNLRYAEIA